MQKVSHLTDFVLIKASIDSGRDHCTFAIIYVSEQWKKILRGRAALLASFGNDSSFYSITFWDNQVDFFANTGGNENQLGDELLEEDETWSFIEITDEELGTFIKPENKLCAFQLKLTHNGGACFQAWGGQTGDEFYTEVFKIDDLK
jgi:hypothetical protein